jgi:ATP-binding cassette subfamily F protein 3
MRAKDVLLEAIAAFSGTVVFVSHDRYFIDRLATRVLEVEDGEVTSYPGNYEDYLRRKEVLAAGEAEAARNNQSSANQTAALANSKAEMPASAVPSAVSAASATTIVIEGGFEPAPKEKARRLNPIKQKQMEDRVSFLEEESPRIESAIAHTEQQLGVYISAAETERLTKLSSDLRGQLVAMTVEWEELMMQLEAQ